MSKVIDILFWGLLLILALGLVVWLGTQNRQLIEPNVPIEFNELVDANDM